jgi:prevent-host-death family protein
MRLGLREANQRFSKAIKAVRAGKEVVLTERGRPIAVIKPINAETAQETALRALVDEPSWRPVKVKGKPISQTIIDDREDRA